MDQRAIGEIRRQDGLPRPAGGGKQPRAAAEARLFEAVETAFAVRSDELCAATRGRCDIAFARQIGMYLARVALGMTLSDAGLMFGRDRTTAAHACRLVEDLRDDRGFDEFLEAMEAFVLRTDARDGSAIR
jgi:hypothetical protein